MCMSWVEMKWVEETKSEPIMNEGEKEEGNETGKVRRVGGRNVHSKPKTVLADRGTKKKTQISTMHVPTTRSNQSQSKSEARSKTHINFF